MVFYETDEEGNPQEVFRIEAPEGGFESSEELLDAYDAALEEMEEPQAFEGADLIGALSLPYEDRKDDEDAIEDDVEDTELA